MASTVRGRSWVGVPPIWVHLEGESITRANQNINPDIVINELFFLLYTIRFFVYVVSMIQQDNGII